MARLTLLAPPPPGKSTILITTTPFEDRINSSIISPPSRTPSLQETGYDSPSRDGDTARRLPLPSQTPKEHDPNLQVCQDTEWDPSAYSLYLKYARQADSGILSQANADTDILSIFAGIFSAVVALFLIRSLDDLKEDYSQTSSILLGIILSQSLGQNISFAPPSPFKPNPSSVVVNSFFAVSIILSISTALGAILCKQWLREYTARLSPVPSTHAFQRHRRYKAFKRWQVSELIALLPVMLHVAVALFFAALAINLTLVNHTVSVVASAMIGIACIAYLSFFILPFFTEAPFVTPLTHLVKKIVFGLIRRFVTGMILPLVFCVASCFEPYICGIRFCITMWGRIVPARRLVRRLFVLRRKAREDSEANIGDWELRNKSSTSLKIEHLARYHGELPRAELVSWLMHRPLEDGDIENVVKLLSGIKCKDSRRMLESDGVDVMLMRRMSSAYFYPGTSGDTIKAIPEHLPAAMACLKVWFGILEEGLFESGHHSSESESMIKALLDVTSGYDTLRVLAASQWIFHFETQPEYREYRGRIRQHLTAHIAGVPELPDDIIRILVDDPYPTIKYLPTVIQLLDNYLEDNKLPSIGCVRAILRSMCTRNTDSAFGIRGYSVSHLLALLLKRDDYRPRLLRLIRALSSINPTPVKGAHLAETLINLLQRSPPLDDADAADVWETISYAPETCYVYDQATLSLAKLYQRQISSTLSRVSINAITALTESIIYHQCGTNREQEFARTAGIVAKCLIDFPKGLTDINILLPSFYALSLTDGYWRISATFPLVTSLLPHIINVLSTPHSERDIAIMRHVLRVIDRILSEDISKGAILTQSLAILEDLAICDDFWVRWLAFSVLKRVSLHLEQPVRRSTFKVVRDDIERRLDLATPTQFIGSDWKDVIDATKLVTPKLKAPVIVQAQAVEADIDLSGIRQLLEHAPETMVCQSGVYVDFPWLFPYNVWVRKNQ